jgi:PAS domain S-box-containing protein
MAPCPALLNSLFELAPEAMILVDAAGVVLRSNAEFTRLFGWTSEEAQGRSIHDLIVPPDRADEAREGTLRVARGERCLAETVRRDRDGRPVEVSVHCTPLRQPDGTLLAFTIYRDISARRRAENALRLSEEKFAKAFRASPDSLAISTVEEGRILEVNDKYLSTLGFTHRDEVVGHTATELGLFVNLEDRGRLVRTLTEPGRTGVVEIPIRTLHAGVRLFQISSEPIDIDGHACMVSVGRDITDSRAAADELRHSRTRLRDLAARLDVVREEQRTAIAREIHDELGQALTGLRLDLSWLARALPAGERAVHERLHLMVDQVDGTIDTVRRISSELRPGVLDELGLVAAVEWQADRFAERARVRTVVAVHGEDIPVDSCRATAVFRILQEALTNVARHACARTVHIDLDITAAAIELAVRDDGRGIADWEAAGASGLGLVGMRERALQWAGKLEVSGAAGRGTTVRLLVPQTRAGEMAITP